MDENKIRVKTTVENPFFHDFMQKQTKYTYIVNNTINSHNTNEACHHSLYQFHTRAISAFISNLNYSSIVMI